MGRGLDGLGGLGGSLWEDSPLTLGKDVPSLWELVWMDQKLKAGGS